jgi:hypothetical protein
MDLGNVARVVVDSKMGRVIQNDPQLGYTLVPDMVKVRAAADAIFADAVPGATSAEALRKSIEAEAARIVLLNGTAEKGLAARAQAGLVGEGFTVTAVGNADRADFTQSELIIYGDPKQATIDALLTRFGISEDRVSTQPAAADRDIAIIVGADQAQATVAN